MYLWSPGSAELDAHRGNFGRLISTRRCKTPSPTATDATGSPCGIVFRWGRARPGRCPSSRGVDERRLNSPAGPGAVFRDPTGLPAAFDRFRYACGATNQKPRLPGRTVRMDTYRMSSPEAEPTDWRSGRRFHRPGGDKTHDVYHRAKDLAWCSMPRAYGYPLPGGCWHGGVHAPGDNVDSITGRHTGRWFRRARGRARWSVRYPAPCLPSPAALRGKGILPRQIQRPTMRGRSVRLPYGQTGPGPKAVDAGAPGPSGVKSGRMLSRSASRRAAAVRRRVACPPCHSGRRRRCRSKINRAQRPIPWTEQLGAERVPKTAATIDWRWVARLGRPCGFAARTWTAPGETDSPTLKRGLARRVF